MAFVLFDLVVDVVDNVLEEIAVQFDLLFVEFDPGTAEAVLRTLNNIIILFLVSSLFNLISFQVLLHVFNDHLQMLLD